MHQKKHCRSFLAGLLLTGTVLSPLATTQAAMIDTDTLLADTVQGTDRTQLRTLLEREDVVRQLQEYGVGAGDALVRVDRMTDQEVAALNNRLGELAAGGDVIAAAGFLFVVLVVTDLLGITNVFPFLRTY